MKKILLGVLLLILAIAGYYWYKFSNTPSREKGPRQQPLAVQKHSDTFNRSVTVALESYFEMSAGFVDADTAKARVACRKMMSMLDSIPLEELKRDTVGIYETANTLLQDIKANAASLVQQTDLKEMRMDFRQVNEQLYSFLHTIHYEGPKLYWQNCATALGENNAASWISKTEEIINPYQGRNDPQYKSAMLHCGEIKDTIKAQ